MRSPLTPNPTPKTMKRLHLILVLSVLFFLSLHANDYTFSKAGYYDSPGSGRITINMNGGWRFYQGALVGEAFAPDYDDSQWSRVNLPNGIELLPVEASGGKNYQGEVWYRKHFVLSQAEMKKKMFFHFEGIMGKSKVWINGHLLTSHFGGFLPVIVDISKYVSADKQNVLTVWADNSDDGSYPPGKPQSLLDFAYFGGIYRDCWLIGHDDTYISDPNQVDKTAGGGLFVSYSHVSDRKADVNLKLNVRNEKPAPFHGKVTFALYYQGKLMAKKTHRLTVDTESDITSVLKVPNPQLWTLETPSLYDLQVSVKDAKGKSVDGYIQKIGIRTIEMRGRDGFYLNGKPYHKLLGANRHQDFAVLGFALTNSLHYRDALKLKNAGMDVIRCAHYPQDPAFMDACDQLGLLVIVATPGWQFWNSKPEFANFIYSDIRNMVRRDRNHPSVLMWEPILNETQYPKDFAKRANDIVYEEYPYPGCYTACDDREAAAGREYFSVYYGVPQGGSKDTTKCYFTREWGDNADDWNAQNSTSRVSREWGEVPMLIQAKHYEDNSFSFPLDIKKIFAQPRQHIGGALWHSFDHQRGYHCDPFYGGIMDAFRQPKTSYYMFMSQRDPSMKYPNSESGPMVYIAHVMSPFSPQDVTVFTNCEQVRLIAYDKDTLMLTVPHNPQGVPHPSIVFPHVFDFMKLKSLLRAGKHDKAYLKAEGLIDGKVVATHVVSGAARPAKIILEQDNLGMPLMADGSDVVVVVAKMVDEYGYVKRLNNSLVRFSIEGEGRLLSPTADNVGKMEWGEAPMLVQSTNKAGDIKVTASLVKGGVASPVSGSIVIKTTAPADRMNYISSELPVETLRVSADVQSSSEGKNVKRDDLKKVEKDQTLFE